MDNSDTKPRRLGLRARRALAAVLAGVTLAGGAAVALAEADESATALPPIGGATSRPTVAPDGVFMGHGDGERSAPGGRFAPGVERFAAEVVNADKEAAPPADAGEPPIETEMVGGIPATEPYPWAASLQVDIEQLGLKDAHFCGGTLVYMQWILTNAHCVTTPPAGVEAAAPAGSAPEFQRAWASGEIPPVSEWKIKVRLNSADNSTGGILVNVTKTIVHEDWNWALTPGKPVSDIAMLKLDRIVVSVASATIASRSARPGDDVRLIGWGLATPDPNGIPTRHLLQLDTKVSRDKACAGAAITDKEICTDNPDGLNGACDGDSGSPALKMETIRGTNGETKVWRVVGGASRYDGVNLCGRKPTVYTDFPAFADWIYDAAAGNVVGPTTMLAAAPPVMTLPYEPGNP